MTTGGGALVSEPAATCPTLREALEKALAFFEANATGETYGAPYVDDPRQFRPDRECNTPAEIAAWEDAVRRVEAGETVEIPRHYWIKGDPEEVQAEANAAIGKGAVAATVSNRQEGQLIAHIAHEPWGVGVSPYADPEMVEIRDALKAALAIPTPDPLTALERAVVEAAVEEISRRWENLGYFILTSQGGRDRKKITAHRLAVATGSMKLADAVSALIAARAAAGTGT